VSEHGAEPRDALDKPLTPADVLAARAYCAHFHEVRAIGPAVVIVVELDGPLRLETLASTDSEFRALQEWCRSNPNANHVLTAFYEARDAQNNGFSDRECVHEERLRQGGTLATYAEPTSPSTHNQA
jgi:hypothetical protein